MDAHPKARDSDPSARSHTTSYTPSHFAAFGAWGIADRELAGGRPPRRGRDRLLRLCRVAAAVVGAVAALTLIFGVCAVALGTWIS